MTTFSQLVDKMRAELKRPELAADIASYANMTIREMHADVQTKGPVYYADNLVENLITVNSANEVFVYDLPNPILYQGNPYVRYASVYRDGTSVSPILLKPGQRMSREPFFYYRVANGFAFVGAGGLNSQIQASWYEYVPSLAYHDVTCRPLTIDELGVYVYHDDYCGEEMREVARCLSTHWMLLRWSLAIEEGVRAKVFKRVGDVERARLAYSAYLDIRQQMVNAEGAGSEAYHS